MNKIINILHLEDNETDAKLIKKHLKSNNIETNVNLVDNEEGFVNALESNHFDIILSDLKLPDYDGYSALKFVKEKYKLCPFIFVSGTMGEDAAIEAMKSGATDYVLKRNLKKLAPSLTRALHESEIEKARIQTEKALIDSVSHLRRFYESGLLGVIDRNMVCQITDANDKFLDMVGYTRDELKSGSIDWMKMTPPEFQWLDEKSTAELKATGIYKVPIEKEYIRKDGTRVPVSIAGAMLDEERFDGIAFVLDITERKCAENALNE